MELEAKWEEGALVVMPEGRIDSSNAGEFNSSLLGLIKDADVALVLDMERLTFISTPGLRVMMWAARTLERRGIKFIACTPSKMVEEVFEISGFDRIIETHKTRAGAIASLRS